MFSAYREEVMKMGLHECRKCGFKFEDAESKDAHEADCTIA